MSTSHAQEAESSANARNHNSDAQIQRPGATDPIWIVLDNVVDRQSETSKEDQPPTVTEVHLETVQRCSTVRVLECRSPRCLAHEQAPKKAHGQDGDNHQNNDERMHDAGPPTVWSERVCYTGM
jgi:hypothetical protein